MSGSDQASAYLTIKQAAKLLRVSEQTLRRWDRTGKLRAERHRANRYRLYARDALVAFAETLRDDPPAALTASRTNLLGSLASFFGRENAIRTLGARLANGERLVTLLGPPGMGKTRLAQRYAELEKSRYMSHGGVWFCDLARACTAADLCSIVSAALGIVLPEGRGGPLAVACIAGELARRGRAVIILDNAEGLSPDARRIIGAVCAAAPEADVLVTSRERLAIDGEVVIELTPLALPPERATAEEVRASEAVKLFEARASAVTGAPDPAPDPDILAALVRSLDGIPLAIELAAAQSRLLTPAELLGRLQQRFSLLAAPLARKTDRHATLRTAVDWSWTLLAPWEQSALAQCSVFEGGFTVSAAEAVLDTSSFPGAPSLFETVGALRDKSLVCVHPASTPGERRLSLYLTIHDYAAERLADLDPKGLARARHARYYVEVGRRWANGFWRLGERAARDRLTLEQGNLLAVFRRASSGTMLRSVPGDLGIAALLCLCPLLQTQGRADELATLVDLALASRPRGDLGNHSRAQLLVARGAAHGVKGKVAASIADLVHARSLAEALRDHALKGEASMFLAVRYRVAGRFAEALSAAEEARTMLRGAGCDRLEGFNLACMGLLLGELGRREEARDLDEQARLIFQRLGDRWGEGLAIGNLGQLDQDAGSYPDARRAYERAIACFCETGDALYEALYRARLGTVEHQCGALVLAHSHYSAAIDAFGRCHSAHLEGVFRACHGALAAQEDRLDEAVVQFDTSRALLETVGAPAFEGALDVHRGQLDLARARLAMASGDTPRAESLQQRAKHRLVVAESWGKDDPEGIPLVSRSHDVRMAVRLLQRAVDRVDTGLAIGPQGAWFRTEEAKAVSLLRRGALRRLLDMLVRKRLSHPGIAVGRDALLASGWPGERMLADAGSKRVRVAIATLRRLGLRDVLLTCDDGYLLHPDVPLRMEAGIMPL